MTPPSMKTRYLAMNDQTQTSELARRLAVVQAEMRADGLDVLVSGDHGGWITDTGDLRYLTDFSIGALPGAIPGAAIVVPAAGSPIVVVPRGPQNNFLEWAKASTNLEVLEAPSLEAGVLRAVTDLVPIGARVGAGATFSARNAAAIEIPGRVTVDYSVQPSPFERARSKKSDVEIGLLRAAQRASDAGMVAFFEEARAGRRHTDAQDAARHAAVAAGADDALVIMNAGTPWMWWTEQGQRRFPLDGIVSVEVNARVRGYSAQLARSAPLGIPTKLQIAILDAANASAEAMVAALRVGATGHDIWAAGMVAPKRAGLGVWGRLGHGVGLAMDEGIAIVENNTTAAEIGMVIAVHGAPWDAQSRQSALLGEQYVVTQSGARPLSEASSIRDATSSRDADPSV